MRTRAPVAPRERRAATPWTSCQNLKEPFGTHESRGVPHIHKFGELPGNVVLNKGEANLPRKCVFNVTQIKSVDRRSIKEKIGTLSKKRAQEVAEGLKLVLSLA